MAVPAIVDKLFTLLFRDTIPMPLMTNAKQSILTWPVWWRI